MSLSRLGRVKPYKKQDISDWLLTFKSALRIVRGLRNDHVSFWTALGEVSEWLKEHAWKACIGLSLSRVRIPPSPPLLRSPVERLGFFVSGYCSVIRVVRQGENPRGFESSVARQRRSLRRRPEGRKSSLPHRHYLMKEPRNAGLFCG